MTDKIYEVLILGSGPAGLQAAIHAARAKVSVLVMGKPSKSSLHGAHIENYCCMERTAGEDLIQQGIQQAEEVGTSFMHEDVIKISHKDQWFIVQNESGENLRCRALIMAMGISRNKLRVPGEKELLGRGVSYCVDCDGGFFRGEPVAVVGNESAAASGALTMIFYASKVNLICDHLEISEALAHQIRESEINLYEGPKVTEIIGQEKVEGWKSLGFSSNLGLKAPSNLPVNLVSPWIPNLPNTLPPTKSREPTFPGYMQPVIFAAYPGSLPKLWERDVWLDLKRQLTPNNLGSWSVVRQHNCSR